MKSYIDNEKRKYLLAATPISEIDRKCQESIIQTLEFANSLILTNWQSSMVARIVKQSRVVNYLISQGQNALVPSDSGILARQRSRKPSTAQGFDDRHQN